MGLGGFSTHDANIAFFNSASIEFVLIVIMLLASLNFACHFAALRRLTLQPYFTHPETKAIFLLLTASVLGIAVLFRLDLVFAVGLSTIALVRGMERSRVRRLLAGMTVGIAPYAIQLTTAGLGNSVRGMVLDPVFHLRGGRGLPIPPPWSHVDGFLQRAGLLQQLSWPIWSPKASQQLTLWFFLVLGVAVFVVAEGWRALRADRGSIRSRTLLVGALFSLGIVPQALQRVDSAHFAWVSCISFGLLPIALFDCARRAAPRVSVRRLALVTGAGMLALVVFVLPEFTATRYADYTLQTFGVHRHSYAITHDGRLFYYGKEDRATAANLVIAEAARISHPGQRLFVGPGDLRKTPYSDAYLYYMLPDLVPATYYIEMDPGVANAPHSGLAQQLASADVVILSKIWDDWSEPNDSRKFGSDEPVRVLASHFCHVGTYLDLYELYRKCR